MKLLLLYLIIDRYNEQSWERYANREIVGPSLLLAGDKNARTSFGPSGTGRNT